MIPLAVPDLSGREGDYLQECISSSLVSSIGPFVGRFEEMISGATGSTGAVATSSGTAGLHVTLVAAGVRRDDLVILPSYTFIASANAIAHAGATPWLFDTDASTWALSPDLLADRLRAETRRDGATVIHKSTGRRVAAIMPVYVLGAPADMDAIVAMARDFALPVVADAAAAIGATYKGRRLGELGADASVFSFNGNKTITSGGGGAVIGRPDLVDRVRHLATTARVGPGYEHTDVGFNYRMTNIEAAVGCAQMERLADMIAAKRRIRQRYAQALKDLAGAASFPEPAWSESACWLSGIVSPTAVHADRLRSALRSAGIDARPFWKPVHRQEPFAGAPKTSMTFVDDLWPRVVPLPCSTALSPSDQEQVIEAVRRAWT